VDEKSSHSRNNPFVNSQKTNINHALKEKNVVNILKKSSQSEINRNAFLNAAFNCDPSAVYGMTSQIRIA
jgi:hypothetical protein